MIDLLLMAPQQGQPGGGYMNLIFIVMMIVVFYLFMIRPQTKKVSDQKKFMEALQKGDKVVTVAGIHGRINKINENGTLELEIDTNVKVVMERSGISMEYTKALQTSSEKK
ncbi:MAG: preprotein translocase subunit YajC [Bacteroidota bacterium]|jgi:preprotein translocase subunit YajC